MRKKEMIAMLLAGGQGSRLGVLTAKVAKPAVAFGGKYRIIDFPLSNCINSGIDTVGVLTQYQPLRLNTHIGIGISWDLDRNFGGVTILPPYEKSSNSEWYTGTANAIYQNLDYIETYHPDYVLILSGDHIYKMDYEVMLDYHKEHKADVTIAAMPVPIEEASRFGVVVAEEDGQISIRLPNTLQAMPAKKSLLRIKKILDDYTYQPYPEYQSAKDIQEENQILPDTGVTVAQEKRWVKEQEGLLLRATDLYSPDVNYNQIEADRKALRKQYPDDSEDED